MSFERNSSNSKVDWDLMPDLAKMTIQHVLYIPSVLLLGIVTGYILGARAVRSEVARTRKRLRD